MINRVELKSQAREQIKGNIATLFVTTLIVGAISATAIGFLLVPPLNLGLISIYLGLARGKNVSIADVFGKLDLFGKSWILHLMMAIYTFLWTLLLYIPGIIKALSYSMAPYILADRPELTSAQALEESKRITQGHKMDLFILQLSFFLWFMLIPVTFGIASIYVIPYVNATTANFYSAIKD